MKRFTFVAGMMFVVVLMGAAPHRVTTQVVRNGHTTHYYSNVRDGHGHVTRYSTRVTQHGNSIQTYTRTYGGNR